MFGNEKFGAPHSIEVGGDGLRERIGVFFKEHQSDVNPGRLVKAATLASILLCSGCARNEPGQKQIPPREPAIGRVSDRSPEIKPLDDAAKEPPEVVETNPPERSVSAESAIAEEESTGVEKKYSETPIEGERAQELLDKSKKTIEDSLGLGGEVEVTIYRIKVVVGSGSTITAFGQGGESQDVNFAVIRGGQVEFVNTDNWVSIDDSPSEDLDSKELLCLWYFNEDGDMGSENDPKKVTTFIVGGENGE